MIERMKEWMSEWLIIYRLKLRWYKTSKSNNIESINKEDPINTNERSIDYREMHN